MCKKVKDLIQCVDCSELMDPDNDYYFESTDGVFLCENCGHEVLYTHDFTQYDDYPLIDGNDGFDGGQYEGPQWRYVVNNVELRKEPK